MRRRSAATRRFLAKPPEDAGDEASAIRWIFLRPPLLGAPPLASDKRVMTGGANGAIRDGAGLTRAPATAR
jgi:hypothetical protein